MPLHAPFRRLPVGSLSHYGYWTPIRPKFPSPELPLDNWLPSNEPPGLCVGKVRLEDGSVILGVLSEPALAEGHRDITTYGGCRAYLTRQPR